MQGTKFMSMLCVQAYIYTISLCCNNTNSSITKDYINYTNISKYILIKFKPIVQLLSKQLGHGINISQRITVGSNKFFFFPIL